MMHCRISALVTTITLLLAAADTAAFAQNDLAYTRAQHIRRGINLSMWYAQAPGDYTAQRLSTFTTPADFKLVHDLGFDHVRLSIDPEPLIAVDTVTTQKAAGVVLDRAAMARLAATAQQITDAGLVVILDIHPETPWKRESTTSPKGIATFLSFWATFSRSFSKTDPNKVYFEILNEPEGIDAGDWAKEQARAVSIIRAEVPRHTLIVGGAHWNGIDTLVDLKPLPDNNLIYNFHDYEPMEFTHQGATWAGDELKPLRGVPYPSSPANVEPLLKSLTVDASRKALNSYGQNRWTIARMQKRIGLASDWGRQHHVPLWCGEFGVYRAFAPGSDRARWIFDMRTTLEADGIGWNMWDYQSNFGLVTKKDNTTTVDPAIAQALGLKVAASAVVENK